MCPIGANLSEPHTSESPPQNWCYRPCTKNYDKNWVTYVRVRREFNGVDYSVSLCNRPCHDK